MLRLFLTILWVLAPVSGALAATYYASPTGTGTGASSGSPFQINNFWAVATPGDTLRLLDGTYTGAPNMIDPPTNLAGTASQKITIQAVNEGKVLIHGQFQRVPILLTSNHHFVIEGLNACCGNAITLKNGNNANFNTYRRIIVWDTLDPNGESVINIWASNGTVLTDIAGWGRGRKVFGRVSDSNTVMLRGFFLGRARTLAGKTVTFAYKSVNGLMANVIGAEDLAAGSAMQGPIVFSSDHYNGAGVGSYTNRLLGSIAYHVDGQVTGDSSVLMRRSVRNTDPGVTVTTISRNNLTIRRNAPIPVIAHDCPEETADSICDDSDWADSVGTLAGGTHTTENGNQAIGSFNNGLLQLGATSQPANGPWIKHCYTAAGTIDTGCNLWPWPMNQRIKEAIVSSGYGARGLDGKGATDLTALMMSLSGSTLSGTGSALHLTFETQPQTTVEDAIIPGFRACVFDASNVKQLSHAAPLVIALQANPGGSTLTGTLSLTPVSGCATWNNLKLDNPGTGYTLRATSTGVTQADTNAFTITAVPVIPVPPPQAQKIRIIPTP